MRMYERAVRVDYGNESVTITDQGQPRATMAQMKERAVAIIRGRLWAAQNGLGRRDDVVASAHLSRDASEIELAKHRRLAQ